MIRMKVYCPDCGRESLYDGTAIEPTQRLGKEKRKVCQFCAPFFFNMWIAFDFALRAAKDERALMSKKEYLSIIDE